MKRSLAEQLKEAGLRYVPSRYNADSTPIYEPDDKPVPAELVHATDWDQIRNAMDSVL